MKKYLFSLIFLLLPTLCFGLTVTAPTAGQLIPAGSTYTSVQWTPSAGATQFNILLSTDSGLTWSLQNRSGKVPGTTFDWAVPPLPKNKTQCLIKVVGFDSLGKKVEVDKSDAFTINALNVIYPNGPADSVDAGHIKTITWDTATLATVTDTKLSYTVDGGLTWQPIATIAGNPGTYEWTVPQYSTDRSAKLKVILMNGDEKAAADTSGTFIIEVSPKDTADAQGTYYSANMEYDYLNAGVFWTGLHETVMDGTGLLDFSTLYWSDLIKAPPSGTEIPYSIAGDCQMAVYDKRGIISLDSNLVLLADPNSFRARNLDFGLSVKSSAGLTDADLEGVYVMGQVGNGWVGRFTATFDGAGNGNIHCEAMTGGCQLADIPLTYSVDPVTGLISDSLGQHGVLSSDGSVFAITDTEYVTRDGLVSVAVGIRKASGGLSDATGSGKFLAATIGISDTHGPWVDIFQVKLNGKGGGTATELYTSWPPLTPTHPILYSIGADGSLGLGPAGTDVQGIVMANGQGFLAVDTAGTGESSLTLGLKKTK